MSYTYLPDGTLFTPDALNDRLAVVEGQLNSLTSSNLAHGALRHDHLPTVINSATKDRIVRLESPARDFDSLLSFPRVPETGDNPLPGVYHTYGDTVNFDAEGITAVVVMFNLNIHSFVYPNQDGTFNVMDTTQKTRNHLAWEDYMGAFFHVRLRTGSETNNLLRTRRGISPGFAMADVTLPAYLSAHASAVNPQRALKAPGMNMTGDFRSHKDFALRTVILKEDLPGGVLSHLEIVGRVKSLATNRSTYNVPPEFKDIRILYSKWNLTVIPIYSEIKLVT